VPRQFSQSESVFIELDRRTPIIGEFVDGAQDVHHTLSKLRQLTQLIQLLPSILVSRFDPNYLLQLLDGSLGIRKFVLAQLGKSQSERDDLTIFDGRVSATAHQLIQIFVAFR